MFPRIYGYESSTCALEKLGWKERAALKETERRAVAWGGVGGRCDIRARKITWMLRGWNIGEISRCS